MYCTFIGFQTCDPSVADVQKSEQSRCSKNHTSNMGGSQLQSKDLNGVYFAFSAAHHQLQGTLNYRSFQIQPLAKKELCQTMIIKSQIKVSAFNTISHITYSRHFGLNHCSEYEHLFKLPERMWENLLVCVKSKFTDTLTFCTH